MMQIIVGLLAMLVSVYLLVWLISYFVLAERLMFYPPAYDETRSTQYDFVTLTHANGQTLQGLWIGQPTQDKWVLLYQHGNAELLIDIVPRLNALHDILQLPVFAYEFRGYGGSAGKYSINNMREDGELAWLYLQQQGYDNGNIVIYGRSLGTSNATHLAKHNNPVAALILEVPMWDAFRIHADYFWTWRGHLENGRRIKHITAPTFILYAEEDQLIHPWHSEKLFQASAASVKERIAFAGPHSKIPNTEKYADIMQHILQQAIEANRDWVNLQKIYTDTDLKEAINRR